MWIMESTGIKGAIMSTKPIETFLTAINEREELHHNFNTKARLANGNKCNDGCLLCDLKSSLEHCQQLEAKVKEANEAAVTIIANNVEDYEQQLAAKEQELKAIPESLEIAITELAYRKQEIRVKDELIERAEDFVDTVAKAPEFKSSYRKEARQWLADASKVVK
jgi:uncharacterized protein (DUF3084 family)